MNPDLSEWEVFDLTVKILNDYALDEPSVIEAALRLGGTVNEEARTVSLGLCGETLVVPMGAWRLSTSASNGVS